MARQGLQLVLLLFLASQTYQSTMVSIDELPYTAQINKLHPNPSEKGIRDKRSVSSQLVEEEKCQISYIEVASVADLLKMYRAGQATAFVPLSAATSGLDACQQAMQDIRKTAQTFIMLSKQIKFDRYFYDYEKLKNDLEETSSRLQQQLEQAKLQATQDAQLKIKEIETEKQALKTANNWLIQKLQEEIENRQSDIISLVALEIHKGNYKAAGREFFQLRDCLTDNRVITKVITKAYDIEKVENILGFLHTMRGTVDANGYRALVDLIDANDSHLMGLIVVADVEDQPRQDLEETLAKLQIIKHRILGVCAEQIRSQIYNHIVRFGQNHPQVFIKYARDVVKRTYKANDDVIMKIIAFSNELDSIMALATMYIELYRQMKVTRQINYTPVIHMAHRIRKSYEIIIKQPNDSLNSTHHGKNLMNKIEKIWEKFPVAIRAIVNGDSVCLMVNDGFYLYVAGHYDSDRDNVEATSSISENSRWIRWRFGTVEDGNKLNFRIRTDPYDDHLYAERIPGNDTDLRIFTWRPSKAATYGVWELQDYDWKSGKFYLRNTFHNEYLTVSKEGLNTSRRVTLRSSLVHYGFSAFWTVDPLCGERMMEKLRFF